MIIKTLLGWVASPFIKFGAIIFAVLGAVGTIYMKGHSAGKSSEKVKAAKQTVERIKERTNVEESNRRAKPSDRRDRLRKYARD